MPSRMKEPTENDFLHVRSLPSMCKVCVLHLPVGASRGPVAGLEVVATWPGGDGSLTSFRSLVRGDTVSWGRSWQTS